MSFIDKYVKTFTHFAAVCFKPSHFPIGEWDKRACSFNNIKRNILVVCACICLILTASCGKKGGLSLKVYEKPPSPTNITAFHRDGEIYIFWHYPVQERAKIKGYQVLKSSDEGVNFNEVFFLKPDELSYIDRDFTAGHKYFYKLRCISVKDVFSDDSVVIKISTSPPPQKLQEVSLSIKSDSLEIKWKADSNVKTNIYKTFQKGSYSLYPINNEPLNSDFFVDKLETSRIAYYTLRPLWGAETRDEGAPSDEIEANPAFFIPSSPVGLTYASVGKKTYLLWKENPEIWVKGYRVYRKKISEEKFVLIGDTTVPVIVDPEPLTSKTYFYVTAMGPVAESSPSEVIQITPIQEE